MRNRWVWLILCVYLFMEAFSVADCADADSYKTEEYYNSTGLDLINAADAYALGFTGKGILLGICDEYVKLSHPEFTGKQNSGVIGMIPEDYDWVVYDHGSHVGGIMAAARNNFGMHGLAFDADLLSGSFSDLSAAYNAFNQISHLKIINNSWGTDFYIDEIGGGKKGLFDLYLSNDENVVDLLADSIMNYDKVLVFAAGNNGHLTAGGESMLAYFKPQTAGNFINVMLINPAQYDKETQTASIGFLVSYSDLVKYEEENSIGAPGFGINSVSSGDDLYTLKSGTSMAAPYVSAAAGLVQQAFPYMNGKQIVDTVLSTANHTFALPQYMLTIQEDYEDPSNPAGDLVRKKVNLFYFGNRPTTAGIEDDLRQYYSENASRLSRWYGFQNVEQFIAFCTVDNMENVDVYDNVPREMIFGQGLLDAGAAVRGPGLLNARRMDQTNFSPASEYGEDQALYSVDTAGYDSVWSNDIGEKRAGLLAADSQYEDLQKIYAYYKQGDVLYGFQQGQEYIDEYNTKVEENGLINLPVGLEKRGEGTLALTGHNTYQGSSIAAGGVLQIDGSIASDAFSVESGTIAGTGSIKGNLYNRAMVQPGSDGKPGTLTVEGDFESAGKIAVAVDNNENGRISVLGSASVNGTTFVPVAGSIYRPDASYEFLTAGSVTGSFISASFTGMLSAEGIHDGTNAQMLLTRENNMADLTLNQMRTYQQMESMYDNLEGQASQREMDRLYSLNTAAAQQALTEIYGGAQATQAIITQRNTVIGKAISARLAQAKYVETQEVVFRPLSFAGDSLEAKAVIPLELDADYSWWMKLTKNWGEIDAQNDMPGINNQSYGVVLGRDEKVDDRWRAGMFFAYGKNDINSNIAKSASRDYRLGVYGGYNKEAVDIYTYLDYGKQDNEANRYLHQLGMQADSRYDSNTLRFGVEAKYNFQYAKEKAWQVSPYAGINVTSYNQDGYMEHGAGVFSQQAEKMHNNYGTGEIGLEVARQMSKGGYAVSLGYKKVFSGSNPEMTIAYSGNPGEKLKISGNKQDTEYIVLGINAQGELAKNWTISGQVENEYGNYSNNLYASVMVRRCW